MFSLLTCPVYILGHLKHPVRASLGHRPPSVPTVFTEGLGSCSPLWLPSPQLRLDLTPSFQASPAGSPAHSASILCLTLFTPLSPSVFLSSPLSQSVIVFIYVFVYSFDLSHALKWKLQDVRHVAALFALSPSSWGSQLTMRIQQCLNAAHQSPPVRGINGADIS